MAKFYGTVGYVKQEEEKPGKVVFTPIERNYYGDVLRFSANWTPSDTLNDNINLSNSISIVADPFAYENFASLRYVKYMGAYWKVKSVEVQRPRLILTIGDVYHGKVGTAPGQTGDDTGD